MPFANQPIGGTTLVRSAIKSPNFNMLAQTGWAINKDGSAFFFNITATGTVTSTTVVVQGASAGIFIYSPGVPALGNLVGSWAASAGNDSFGNAYPAGLQITGTGQLLAGNLIVNTSGVFLYGTTTTPTVVTHTSGSGTIPIPTGVATVKAECWGAGSGAAAQAQFTSVGGSSGEYSAEPALAVTVAGVAYAVGTGGAGITQNGVPANATTTGGNSTLTGTGPTVTGHGGSVSVTSGGTTTRTKGTGYLGTTHHDGAIGGVEGSNNGGPSGAASAGTAAAGVNGSAPSGDTGAPATIAPSGGGNGGKGGNGSIHGVGTDGTAGSVPGGGGGAPGFSFDSSAYANSAAGANGQVRITYTVTTSNALIASIAQSSGTDSFGNAFIQGITVYGATQSQRVSLNSTTISLIDTVNDAQAPGTITLSSQGSTTNDTVQIASPMATGTDIQPTLNVVKSASGSLGQVQAVNSYFLIKTNTSFTPAQPTTGAIFWSDNGHYPRFVSASSGDTNAYEYGVVHLKATATPQTISSTTGATVTGLSCTVGIGTYHIRARIIGKVGATAGGQNLNITGPAISAGNASLTSLGVASAVIGVSTSSAISSNMATGAFAANVVFVSHLDAWYTFTASGTLSLQAGEGTNLDTWTVQDGMMDVSPAI
jgi:hypothetical protein